MSLSSADNRNIETSSIKDSDHLREEEIKNEEESIDTSEESSSMNDFEEVNTSVKWSDEQEEVFQQDLNEIIKLSNRFAKKLLYLLDYIF